MSTPSDPHTDRRTDTSSSISAETFQSFLKTLKLLAAQPELLADVSEDDRIGLMKAAGSIAHPTIDEQRKISRTARKIRRERRKMEDRQLRQNTGIREARQAPVFYAPKQLADQKPAVELQKPRMCYICKDFFTAMHFFYDGMCVPCGDFNYQKRFQSADLTGRTALVTGGRVKIGYYTALKLLRAGARTIVTTRFPHDSAVRFSREEDFAAWKDRLQIYGLDLRHSPSVEMFARFILNTEERLDFLVNNAAQTVRKPPGFYKHLMEIESLPFEQLPEAVRPILRAHEQCKQALDGKLMPLHLDSIENTLLKAWPGKSPGIGIRASAHLSMIPYGFDEETQNSIEVFPEGKLDADLQQVDLRTINTWRLKLADVETPEMLEVHLVNAVAPFILASKLKALMLRHPTQDKHIVNASAMEGKFTFNTKTDKHPHTNMAKAAINMMTRTSAQDYIHSGIHMNAVDTGWITDEDPAHLSRHKKEMHDFEPPLDIVDGAARLVDPIFTGLLTGEHVWGKFLKDYKPTEW